MIDPADDGPEMYSVLSPEVRELAKHWHWLRQDYVFGQPSQEDCDKYNEQLREGLVQFGILRPGETVCGMYAHYYVCVVTVKCGVNQRELRIPIDPAVLPIHFSPAGLDIGVFGFEIQNPAKSECGRFAVSPGYYGFVVYNTGGGNTCWRLDCKLGTRWYQLILTDGDLGHTGELQDICLYESDGPGDELGTVCVFSADFKELP